MTTRINLLSALPGILLLCILAPRLRADVLEMQNGDRYSGKILSVSGETVMLDSELLGKIAVPRNKVATVAFGTNAAAPTMGSLPVSATGAPTNLPVVTPATPLTNTNVDLSAAIRQLGGDTNFVAQIRQQILAGNPEASAKYDDMVNGLLSGQINMSDLRQQAQASAAQLRELKRQYPEAAEQFDAYLQVLDSFIKETASQPAGVAPAAKSP